MSSSSLRIIAILLALGAIVLGYIGYQTGTAPEQKTFELAQPNEPEPVRIPVMVAARDIAPEQLITEDDVTTMFVEQQYDNSFRSSQQVIGKQSKLAVDAGDLVLKQHLYDFSSLVNAIRPGERAIAIRVDEVTGTGGFIQPGDKVDVVMFLPSGKESGDNSSAQRILSAVRVLAYGNVVEEADADVVQREAKINQQTETTDRQNADDTAGDVEQEQDPTGKQSKTAVLAIGSGDLSPLLLAESMGRLRLALVGKEKPSQDSPKTAQQTEAEQQQYVTLRKFRPISQEDMPEKTSRPAPRPAKVTPQPRKITVHRGVEAATVSVD